MEIRAYEDGVKRIGKLYWIEAKLRGLDPQARLAGRQERSAPLVADMQTWLVHHRTRVAAKSPLGEALAYISKYWDGLKLFLTDGRIEIDNNSVERTIRPIALNRKTRSLQGTTREPRTGRPSHRSSRRVSSMPSIRWPI
jgi:transposase